MNHSSEWTKFFDENTWRFRFKHKGTGLVRDTLMAIGKVLKTGGKNVAKKAAEVTTEKVGQKVGEMVTEKGAAEIQQVLRKRENAAPSQDAKKKLHKILQNQLPRKPASNEVSLTLNQILANQV